MQLAECDLHKWIIDLASLHVSHRLLALSKLREFLVPRESTVAHTSSTR